MALDEIGTEAGNPGSGGFWIGVVMVAGGAVLGRWLFGWLLSFVLWPVAVEEIIQTAGMLGGFLVVLRWLHRRGTARDLRVKLLTIGIPVCVECGYLLRGLSPEIGRCPECGSEFSPQAATILQNTPKA